MIPQPNSDDCFEPQILRFPGIASDPGAPSDDPTFAELAEAFLRNAEAIGKYEPEAIYNRRKLFKDFGAAVDFPISACKPFHLSDWVEAHDWAPSTRKGNAASIKAVLNWAVKQGRVSSNPYHAVNYKESDPKPAMPDEVLDKVKFRSTPAYEDALAFLRLTSIRLSGLYRMNWGDVRWDERIVILRKTKSGKPKVLRLTDECVSLLRRLYQEQSDLFEAPSPDSPVFRNTKGKRWTRRTLGQNLRRMLSRHGIDCPARLHGIRHQCATEAIRNGAKPLYVSEMLGHSSFSVTEKYYLHIGQDNDEIRKAMEAAQPKKKPKPADGPEEPGK